MSEHPDHGSNLPGSLSGSDLKKRIQGFGGGPSPPPESANFWGAVFGHEEVGISFAQFYEDTVKGMDSMLNEFAEEFMGEPAAFESDVHRQQGRNGRQNTQPAAMNSSSSSAKVASDRDLPLKSEATCRHCGRERVRLDDEFCACCGLRFPKPSSEESRPMSEGEDNDKADSPGQYCIVGKETFLSKSVGLGGEVVRKLECGEEVSIEEVVVRQEDHRIRGRVRCPEGWISLYNLQNGYRWAKRLGALNAEQKAQEISSASSTECQQDPPLLQFDDEPEVLSSSSPHHQAVSSASSAPPKESSQSSRFKVGDRVLRKGQEAVIISIDQTMDPPSCTVRVCADGHEVGCELHMLQEACNSTATTSVTEEQELIDDFQKKLTAADDSRVDLLNIDDQPQSEEPQEKCKAKAIYNAPIPCLPPPGSSIPLLPPPGGKPLSSSSSDLLGFDPDSSPKPTATLEVSVNTGFGGTGLTPIQESEEQPLGFPRGLSIFDSTPSGSKTESKSGVVSLGLEPVQESQGKPLGLPRGLSIFDPMPSGNKNGSTSGYPGDVVTAETCKAEIATPPKAAGGFNVPRGISLFDPLSEKNLF